MGRRLDAAFHAQAPTTDDISAIKNPQAYKCPARETLKPRLGSLRRSSASTAGKATKVPSPAPAIIRPVQAPDALKIGRAHVCTPVPNAHLVCRLLLEKK